MLLRQAHRAEMNAQIEAATAGLQSEHVARRQACRARTQHAIAVLPGSMTKGERQATIARLRAEEAAELAALDAHHRESIRAARRMSRRLVKDAQRQRSRAIASRQRHERVHLAILMKAALPLPRGKRRLPPFKSITARVLMRSTSSNGLPPI